jgi:hypothetical protein
MLLLAAGAPEPAPVPPARPAALLVRPDGIAPEGFSLVLSPAGDPDGENQYPAGEWLALPAGDYWAFLEGPQAIGWSATRLELAPRRGEDQGVELILPVRDAGRVEIESPFPPAAEMVARLVGVDSHQKIPGEPQEAFSRSLPLGETKPGAALPVGRSFAAIYSRRQESYLALSRPFAIEKGKTTRVAPRPPAEGRADFLLVLERRPPARQAADQEVGLKLNFPGGERRPDLVVPTANRVYALWYGLPPGAHRLLASSASHFLGDRLIELRPGEVGHHELPLDRRPNVRVKLELPENLRRAGPLTLEMRSIRPQVWLDPWKVKADAKEMLLEKVPPGDSEIALRSPPWVFRSRLDLRGGEDRQLDARRRRGSRQDLFQAARPGKGRGRNRRRRPLSDQPLAPRPLRGHGRGPRPAALPATGRNSRNTAKGARHRSAGNQLLGAGHR